jgi:hypothetical protein
MFVSDMMSGGRYAIDRRRERSAPSPPIIGRPIGRHRGVVRWLHSARMRVLTSSDRVDPGPSGGGSVSAPPRGSARARRPAVVTILAILQLLAAAVYGLMLAILVLDGPEVLDTLAPGASEGTSVITLEIATLVIVVGGFFVAALAAGILLLRMRQLGWTITMLLAGLSLGTSIYLWWTDGTALSIWLLVQVVTVFYLNQRQVREAFGISRRESGGALDQGRP